MAKIQPFQSRLDTTFADPEPLCPFMLIGIRMIFDILSQSIHIYFCGNYQPSQKFAILRPCLN